MKAAWSWGRDPKWWAVLFLAWTLGVIFGDVRPALGSMKTEHSEIKAADTAAVGLLGTIVTQLRIQTNAQVQACAVAAKGSEVEIAKCFGILNGEEPKR